MIFNHNTLIINALNNLRGGGKSPVQVFVFPLSKAGLFGAVLGFFIQPLCVIANEVKQSRTTGIRYGLLRRSSSQ